LLRELGRLKVRIIEAKPGGELPDSVDLLVIGSDVPSKEPVHQLLRRRRSRPEIILLETSRPAHVSPAYGNRTWCFHKPLQTCLVQACLRSIVERRKLADRLARREGSSRDGDEDHSVDDLWLVILDRLNQSRTK
jgi:hypothetical protein